MGHQCVNAQIKYPLGNLPHQSQNGRVKSLNSSILTNLPLELFESSNCTQHETTTTICSNQHRTTSPILARSNKVSNQHFGIDRLASLLALQLQNTYL